MINQEDAQAIMTPIPSVFRKAFEGPAIATLVVTATQTMKTWSGAIAQVGGYVGNITSVVIRKGTSDLAVPATLKMGDAVELHAFGYLDSSSPAVVCGMRATVTKPGGQTLTGQYEMTTKQNPGQTLRFSIMNISIDQPGQWTAVIEYYAKY